MTSLAELPGVLVVADSYANVWTEENGTDLATGNPVTYRRTKMFIRVDGEPNYYRLNWAFAREAVDHLPPDELAAVIGRQAAIAIHAVRNRAAWTDPED